MFNCSIAYSVRQVAEIFGVHPNTIKNHIKAGFLKHRRTKPVTGNIRITSEDLEKYQALLYGGGEALRNSSNE